MPFCSVRLAAVPSSRSSYRPAALLPPTSTHHQKVLPHGLLPPPDGFPESEPRQRCRTDAKFQPKYAVVASSLWTISSAKG
jgi:hypothetical protein